ncbi:MAG: aminotransferase class IV [Balneolaceae bacterium]
MSKNERWIWVNGEWMRDSDAVLPAETKGLLYGAGCFETFRSYGGRFLHLDDHIERFNRGLTYLGFSRSKHLAVHEVRPVIVELLERNGWSEADARIRIQGSLGRGSGYSLEPDPSLYRVMTADLLQPQPEGYSLSTVPTRVVPSQSRQSDLKLSNTLHYMKAWQEARRQGAVDALMLTVDGYIAETAIANIFWKSGNGVYTPSEQCDLLPGIVREIVCSLFSTGSDSLKGAGRLETGFFKPEVLEQAEQVWVTNSVKEIQPVIAINGTPYPVTGPFYEALFTAFENYKIMNLN